MHAMIQETHLLLLLQGSFLFLSFSFLKYFFLASILYAYVDSMVSYHAIYSNIFQTKQTSQFLFCCLFQNNLRRLALLIKEEIVHLFEDL